MTQDRIQAQHQKITALDYAGAALIAIGILAVIWDLQFNKSIRIGMAIFVGAAALSGYCYHRRRNQGAPPAP
ncbi:MAG: hypothetical protein WC683_11895 [bacterium]